MNKKFLAMALALVLLIGGVVSGSLAWLTAETAPVTNTFTQSNINITLTEKAGGANKEFKMIPGHTITKDPKVTVVEGSEDCWLFVKVEKENNFDTYMTYTMADGWTLVDGTTNVYARSVMANATEKEFGIIKDDKVTVKDTVSSTDMTVMASNQPKLTFTAYAVQYYKTNGDAFTAAQAWAEANS